MISNLLIPYLSNIPREISKIEWRLSNLSGQERVDLITDIKKKQKSVKTNDLDSIRRKIMNQRRKARQEKKNKRKK